MSTTARSEARFIGHLRALVDRDDRGSLAALRRGVGRTPGAIPAAFAQVAPWLPDDAPAWDDRNWYDAATLFALHHQSRGIPTGDDGDFGKSLNRLRRARQREHNPTDSLDRRVTALLAAERDHLPYDLRQLITLLRGEGIGVDYLRLLRDLRAWGHPDRYVQRRWARNYYRGTAPSELTDQHVEEPDES
ncbi:MAG: type I-E CRISPR-associated protein Cse2/CasB [bacterium]|nr:type I-E CRISPR-associated protein Cse2/CasB [bacterium]